MRKLLAAFVILFAHNGFAQCPFTVSLQVKGGTCFGKDTLVINAANKLASIKWYKNGVLDTTLTGKIIGEGKAVTVVGGLGFGTANNQVSAVGVYVHTNGYIYNADGLGGSIGGRVLKFPPNSTIGTSGTVAAGSNGIGNATNQLQSPCGMVIDKSGYLYVVDYNTDRILKFPPNSTSASNGVIVAGGNGVGAAANQLNRPWAIDIDASGNLYIADRNNNRVQKFPPNSTSATNGITVAGGNGAGVAANQLNSPVSVSVDAVGNLYVGEYNNKRVQKFPFGSTSSTMGVVVAGGNGTGVALNQITPLGSTVDQYGNLYVADLANNRVVVFPPGSTSATNGIVVMGGYGYGSANNQLSFVDGVSVDSSGNIYAADNFNYRIQKSAPILSSIDSTRIPTTPGTYYAVVTDTSGCTVTTNSITITGAVAPFINIGTFGNPSACAPTNAISYVAYIGYGGSTPAYQWQVNGVNAGTNSATFSAALAYQDVVSCILTSNDACATTPTAVSNKETVTAGKPVTVSLTHKGSACTVDTLLISSTNKPFKIEWYKNGVLDTTLKVTTTGNTTNGVTVAGGNGRGNANNQFLGVTSMALDAMGNIYANDSYSNSRVLKFPPNSTSSTKGVTVVNGASAIPYLSPLSVTVDVNGNIFVLDGTQGILKLPPGNATSGTTVAAGNGSGAGLNQIYGYAFCLDASSNIYVSDTWNNRVIKFPAGSTSATNGIVMAGGNGAGAAANQLNYPTAVMVDNTGNIYVADYKNNRIQKFPPNSTSATSGTTIAGGNGVGAAANQFSGPIWICFDANGNLLVADQQNNRIQKFTPNSTNTTNGVAVAGGNGSGSATNQLAAPSSVVADAAGNVFVSDFQNNRIQKFPVIITSIDTARVPTATGTYTAVITDSLGCSFTTNAITIGTKTKPNATIIADKPNVCAGSAMAFTASITNATGLINYQWQVNGINVGANNTHYINSTLLNGDVIRCIVTITGGCNTSDTSNTIFAHIYPLPVMGPVANVSIALGQSTVLNIPVTGNIASYLWSPSPTLSNNTILNPTATPTKNTVYTLKVMSTDSCVVSDSIKVNVSSNIYFTSAFTPNGDGKNDVFYVLGGLAGDKIKDFSVFDRWGKRIFQVQNVLPNDKSFGWDGRLNGTLLQSGTYVYIVTIASANGTETKYNGAVLLMQ